MSEHDEQRALVEWTHLQGGKYPELRRLYAIPNGGFRNKATAGKLKAEGVRPGVPDLCLPLPRRGLHGLYIEMKFGSGKCSPEQLAEHIHLEKDGYGVVICYRWLDAAKEILWYLGIDEAVLRWA